MTDKNIKRIAKIFDCSKTNCVKTVFRYITTEQLIGIKKEQILRYTKGEEYKQLNKESREDNEKSIPAADEEDDEIDWEEEDDDNDEDEIELDDDIDMEEGWEENSGKHIKKGVCKICGETIEGCICGNLDGFDDIGETILE